MTKKPTEGKRRRFLHPLGRLWGVFPFGVVVLCIAAVVIWQVAVDVTLRSVPLQILYWSLILSVFVLLVWMLLRLYRWIRTKGSVLRVIYGVFCTVLALGGVVSVPFLLVVSVFSYTPEHVVEHDGITMVACVESWLDTSVTYYPYQNALFRGANSCGHAYYGSGSFDPFETGAEPKSWTFYDLDGNLIEQGGENESKK